MDAARSALGSASRASLSRLLELEKLRLEMKTPATRRDAIASAAGIDPTDLDPNPLLRSRDVNAHLEALARERAVAAAAAAAAPPRATTLGGLASLSPWEQLTGQGASVARAVGGVVSMGTGGGGEVGGEGGSGEGGRGGRGGGGGRGSGEGGRGGRGEGGGGGGGGGGVGANTATSATAAATSTSTSTPASISESYERAREDRLLADLHALASRRRTSSGDAPATTVDDGFDPDETVVSAGTRRRRRLRIPLRVFASMDKPRNLWTRRARRPRRERNPGGDAHARRGVVRV